MAWHGIVLHSLNNTHSYNDIVYTTAKQFDVLIIKGIADVIWEEVGKKSLSQPLF